MADDPHQPDCDGPEYVDILVGNGEPLCRQRTCCAPPPSAAQLLRRAEDDWLVRQRDLATAD